MTDENRRFSMRFSSRLSVVQRAITDGPRLVDLYPYVFKTVQFKCVTSARRSRRSASESLAASHVTLANSALEYTLALPDAWSVTLVHYTTCHLYIYIYIYIQRFWVVAPHTKGLVSSRIKLVIASRAFSGLRHPDSRTHNHLLLHKPRIWELSRAFVVWWFSRRQWYAILFIYSILNM